MKRDLCGFSNTVYGTFMESKVDCPKIPLHSVSVVYKGRNSIFQSFLPCNLYTNFPLPMSFLLFIL